jgi:hypothetical protein
MIAVGGQQLRRESSDDNNDDEHRVDFTQQPPKAVLEVQCVSHSVLLQITGCRDRLCWLVYGHNANLIQQRLNQYSGKWNN